jgi:hypothetical protein
MAGLAAALNVTEAIEALGEALGSRGADAALCRVAGAEGARLEICVRAVMPSVARVVGATDTVVAALAVDGVASVTELDAHYAASGPRGLLQGPGPYAVVLADGQKEALVLARNGDGPGLYYAWHQGGWLVASEPTALIAAGIPANADVGTVRRFISDGVCDDGAASFFEGIARVRPNQSVVLAADGQVATHTLTPPDEPPPDVTADGDGQVAVLLAPGLPGAAVLGAALVRADAPKPLAVHTVAWPRLGDATSRAPGVLVPLPQGMVRVKEHRFDPSTLDWEGFLRDLGEPAADLDMYCAWSVARGLDGGMDTLLDSTRGPGYGWARLGDRLRARYGVAVEYPLRAAEAEGIVGDATLMSIASRGLLPPVVKYAVQDEAEPVSVRQVVLALREQVAAALATPRPWADEADAVERLRRLIAGRPVDPAPLLRTYVVERWLRLYGIDPGVRPTPAIGRAAVRPRTLPKATPPPDEPPVPSTPAPKRAVETPSPARRAPKMPKDMQYGGATWMRVPVRTEIFGPDDLMAPKVAWYASTALSELRALRRYDGAEAWFAVLSAKPLAVSQRRATPLWEITPSAAARTLSRLADGPLNETWTMQVALEEGGGVRVGSAVLAEVVGLRGLANRLMPPAAAYLSSPRPDAVAPADGAVVRPPFLADEAAASLRDALKYALPSRSAAALAGCAIVAADERGSKVLGYAPGPKDDAVPGALQLVAELCADNPAGQGNQRTPLVLLVPAAPPERELATASPAASRLSARP